MSAGAVSPPAAAVSHRRVYRRPAMRLICVLYLMFVALFAAWALDVGPRDPGAADAGPGWSRVLFGAIAVGLLWLAWRQWRIGVYVSPAGVLVRNVLGAHRLEWDEIEAFGAGTYRGPGGFDAGVVRLRDGRVLRITALNPPLGHDTLIPRLLAALNDELERARRGSPASAR